MIARDKSKKYEVYAPENIFGSFGFIFSLLLTHRISDAYLLRFLRVLRSGRKKNKAKNSLVFFSISLEWTNNALFAQEIAIGIKLGLFPMLFANRDMDHVYLSVH